MKAGRFGQGWACAWVSGLVLAGVGGIEASAGAEVVSKRLSAAITGISSNVQPLASTGFLTAKFAYVTGGPSQTGPAGTQFSALPGFRQYLSIDLGFRTFEFQSGSGTGNEAGSILLANASPTDSMQLFASDNINSATLTFAFKDTRDFLALESALPSPFPAPSAFSPDLSNNGWGGSAPSFGFQLLFQFNGQNAFVQGDLYPSTLANAAVPAWIPEPAGLAVLGLLGPMLARRRV
jgi:hypothetical protein